MDILQTAISGALSLVKLQRNDGSFRYRYDSRDNRSLKGYNVLRHAGAIWCLLDVYKEIEDNRILECARQSAGYLLNTYLRFFRDPQNVCICENNKIKLGGNALAALALLSLYEVTGNPFLLAVSEELCRFMLSQRAEHGMFVHKRYFRSGKISDFQSMYYTGEALLAILTLYRITGEKKWFDAVTEIETELAAENYGVEEQSHWMLYTLELLCHYDNSPIFYDHAGNIACHILDNPDYLSWSRSTPLACRSEGLLAFVRTRQPENVNDRELIQRCLEQISSNCERQLQYRLSDGSFIRGGGDQRNDEVRIDYIQHNVSSFLHLYRIAKGRR
jgi:hypothetical protein